MAIKIIASVVLSISLTACFGQKPFQPHPPEFTQWVKNGVSAEGNKGAMRQCGYLDIFGYGGDRVSTLNDHAEQENCMFRNGFKYKSGFKGICDITKNKRPILPACESKTQPKMEIP